MLRSFRRFFLIIFVSTLNILSACKPAQQASKSPVQPNATVVSEDVVPPQALPSGIERITRTREMDLLHSKLEVRFDWAKQHLIGKATLQLRPYFYPQRQLSLDAKGMDIKSVHLLSSNGLEELQFDYNGESITIRLDRPYTRHQEFQLVINYVAKPNEAEQKSGKSIRENKGLYFINPLATDSLKPMQIWTQGETESNSYWFPTIDSPNERCTQEMFITVDSKFKTLSNGILKSQKSNADGTRTDHWIMDKPHAPYLFMMAVGDFAVVNASYNGLPLEYWVEKAYAPHAAKIFANTPEMIGYFSRILNYPYPWAKYSQVVVRDFVSGAMENTTASVFMEDVQIDSRTLKDYNWDYIIAHELIHQWFGNLVTCESWSHLPLNEGFADYGEYLWNEYKYGQDEADYQFMNDLETYFEESEEKNVPLIRFRYDDADDMFDAHSYQKSARVIHMLRTYVGDDAFFESLNRYLTSNAFKSVEIEHLRLAFEEVTGEDLNWFFDQWFFVPGHPVIDVTHKHQQDTLYVAITQVQDTEKSTVYRLPLYLDIYAGGSVIQYPVNIQNVQEEFRIPMKNKPDLVVMDGTYQLLAEVSHDKSEDELIFQYYNAKRFPARDEALQSLWEVSPNERIIKLMFDALRDPFFRVRAVGVDYFTEHLDLATTAIEERIVFLANDSTSDVRSSAISFMASKNYSKYSTDIKEALQDSAYSVVGTALSLILEFDPDYFEKNYRDFDQYNDINIILPIATHKLSMPNQANWFINKAVRMRTADLYYFFHYFNTYLLNASSEDRKKGLNYYGQIAGHHPNYIVRFSAFQGLMVLSDMPGAQEAIKKVISHEKDKRLLDLYKDLELGG